MKQTPLSSLFITRRAYNDNLYSKPKNNFKIFIFIIKDPYQLCACWCCQFVFFLVSMIVNYVDTMNEQYLSSRCNKKILHHFFRYFIDLLASHLSPCSSSSVQLLAPHASFYNMRIKLTAKNQVSPDNSREAIQYTTKLYWQFDVMYRIVLGFTCAAICQCFFVQTLALKDVFLVPI